VGFRRRNVNDAFATVDFIGTYIWENLGYAIEHDIRTRALANGILSLADQVRVHAGHRERDSLIWMDRQLRIRMWSGSRRRGPDILLKASGPVVGSFWNLLEGICDY
jgi:hypothetical protein